MEGPSSHVVPCGLCQLQVQVICLQHCDANHCPGLRLTQSLESSGETKYVGIFGGVIGLDIETHIETLIKVLVESNLALLQ